MGGAPHRRSDEPAALAAAGRPGRAPGRPPARRALRERLPLLGRREPAGRSRVCGGSRCWSGASPPGSRRSPPARAPVDRTRRADERRRPTARRRPRPPRSSPRRTRCARGSTPSRPRPRRAATTRRSSHEAFRDAGLLPAARAAPLRRPRVRPARPSTASSRRSRAAAPRAAGCSRSGPRTRCSSPRTSRERAQDELFDGRALHRVGELRLPGRARRAASTAATASAGRGTSARACPMRRTTCRSCRVGDGDERSSRSSRARDFRMLDNWGDLIGLKGSGSHSVVIDDVVVPEHHTITLDEWMSIGVPLDARLPPARQPALRRVVRGGRARRAQLRPDRRRAGRDRRVRAPAGEADAPGRRRRGAQPRRTTRTTSASSGSRSPTPTPRTRS